MIHLRKWNAPGNILLWISLVMSCFALPWAAESFVRDGEFYTDTETVSMVDFELESDMKISQTFLCRGTELTQINTFIDNVSEGAGKLTGTLLDEAGEALELPVTYVLDSYEMENVIFPRILSEELKIGETYTIEWYCEDINAENPPTIRMYESSSPVFRVSVNGTSYPMKLYLGYLYDGYYDMGMMVWTGVALLLLIFFSLWEIEVKDKAWNVIREGVLVAVAIGGHFIFAVINESATPYRLWTLMANGVPIYILARLLFLFTHSLPCTGVLTSLLCFVGATANYYVEMFRGSPIAPWDIASIQTAATVAGNYKFECSYLLLFMALFCLFLCQFSFLFVWRSKRKATVKSGYRSIGIILLCVVLYRIGIYQNVGLSMYNIPESYEREGVVAAFIRGFHYSKYATPQGYSEEKCQEILQAYAVDDTSNPQVPTAQNIIVIMNETFADLRVVADNDIVDCYMPYIESMEGENVLKADLYVPVIGGGTANAEFEVLAESTCAFTPQVPYQTLITGPMEGLVSALNDYDYYTEAFHPYTRENWNRDKVYTHMGFDEYVSQSEMQNREPRMVRWCISDYSNYQQIIYDYENKKSDNFFVFNITMQNHGGYETEFDNFENTVDLSEYGDFPQTETYFSLLQESDRQFEALVEYFSQVEEPTLIVFFGDHQPAIENEFYELLYGKGLGDLEDWEDIQRYITPLVIWANYDIEELDINIDKLSTNYLGAFIVKAANLPMTPYQVFLEEMYETFPVFSGTGIYNGDGEFYSSYYRLEDEEEITWLENYQYLQYNRLKGK